MIYKRNPKGWHTVCMQPVATVPSPKTRCEQLMLFNSWAHVDPRSIGASVCLHRAVTPHLRHTYTQLRLRHAYTYPRGTHTHTPSTLWHPSPHTHHMACEQQNTTLPTSANWSTKKSKHAMSWNTSLLLKRQNLHPFAWSQSTSAWCSFVLQSSFFNFDSIQQSMHRMTSSHSRMHCSRFHQLKPIPHRILSIMHRPRDRDFMQWRYKSMEMQLGIFRWMKAHVIQSLAFLSPLIFFLTLTAPRCAQRMRLFNWNSQEWIFIMFSSLFDAFDYRTYKLWSIHRRLLQPHKLAFEGTLWGISHVLARAGRTMKENRCTMSWRTKWRYSSVFIHGECLYFKKITFWRLKKLVALPFPFLFMFVCECVGVNILKDKFSRMVARRGSTIVAKKNGDGNYVAHVDSRGYATN